MLHLPTKLNYTFNAAGQCHAQPFYCCACGAQWVSAPQLVLMLQRTETYRATVGNETIPQSSYCTY